MLKSHPNTHLINTQPTGKNLAYLQPENPNPSIWCRMKNSRAILLVGGHSHKNPHTFEQPNQHLIKHLSIRVYNKNSKDFY
jgi:hypothetical protein